MNHSPIHYIFTRKWRFTLTGAVRFYLDNDFPAVDTQLHFCDAAGNQWCRIYGRVLEISEGYSWNGCSPRPLGHFGIWWIGTPDFKASILASLPHDVCYQMMDQPGFPYSRADIDRIFLRVMQLHGFPLARIYWGAVRIFGGIQHSLTK